MDRKETLNQTSELVNRLRTDGCNFSQVTQEIEFQKKAALLNGDEELANKLWSYEILIDVHRLFLKMFNELQLNRYYEAWCTAEQVDIHIKLLRKNGMEAYGYVRDIEMYLPELQSRYPYKLFMSTVFEIKKEICTICGQPVSVRNPCGHKVGMVYNGRLCQHEVQQFNLLGADVVQNPEHKYAVLFPQFNNKQIDCYDYTGVESFIRNWKTPFNFR